MNRRDRLGNLGGIRRGRRRVAGRRHRRHDPRPDPRTGRRAARGGAIGIAFGLTAIPLFWLAAYARRRRVAYRGSWVRAARRGAWVAIVVALFVALRIQGAFQLPIALFVLTMVVIAEATLSVSF